MGRNYSTYKNGFKVLKLATLGKERELLCLRFAKNCMKTDKVKNVFPLNNPKHGMKLRNRKKYKTNNLSAMLQSTTLYFQHLFQRKICTKCRSRCKSWS